MMDSSATTVLGFVLLACLVAIVVLAAGRFFSLRSRGTAVVLRRLPAKGLHGWRHGVLRYSGEYVEFYKLRSVSPSHDLRFNRLTIEITGSRPLTDDEAVFISEGAEALHVTVGGEEFELAMDIHASMAFNAWVEASPSARQQRMDHRQLRHRAENPRTQGSNMPQDPTTWRNYYD